MYLICKRTNMYWFPSLFKEMQHFFILRITVDLFHWKVRVLLMFALILYCIMDWLTTGVPRMIDVMMWSQQFDAFTRFVKENQSIRIPIILGIRSFNPTVKASC